MYVLQCLKSQDNLHSPWAKKIIFWIQKKIRRKTNHKIYCVMWHICSWRFLLHIPNTDFRKQGMKVDAFKEGDHMSMQTASGVASMVPSCDIITEKVMPSLSPGWADISSESSSKQCPLLYSLEASSMMGNSNVSTDNLSHNQGFQHARQLDYLDNSDIFLWKSSSVTQTGIHEARYTLEIFTPLLPASEPGMNPGMCSHQQKYGTG